MRGPPIEVKHHAIYAGIVQIIKSSKYNPDRHNGLSITPTARRIASSGKYIELLKLEDLPGANGISNQGSILIAPLPRLWTGIILDEQSLYELAGWELGFFLAYDEGRNYLLSNF